LRTRYSKLFRKESAAAAAGDGGGGGEGALSPADDQCTKDVSLLLHSANEICAVDDVLKTCAAGNSSWV